MFWVFFLIGAGYFSIVFYQGGEVWVFFVLVRKGRFILGFFSDWCWLLLDCYLSGRGGLGGFFVLVLVELTHRA